MNSIMKRLTKRPVRSTNTTPKTVVLAPEVTPFVCPVRTVALSDAASHRVAFSATSAIDLTEQIRALDYEFSSATHREVHTAC